MSIIQGPDVEISPTTLDFGLVEYGETIEKIIEIKNLSPIVVTCHIEEIQQVTSQQLILICNKFVLQEKTDSHLSLPDGTELQLKPIELYRMPIRLAAKEEGVHLSHLQIHIDDGKTM